MTALIDILNEEKRLLCDISVYESVTRYEECRLLGLKCENPQTETTRYSIKICEEEISKNKEELEKFEAMLTECHGKILEYFKSITNSTNINEKGE